MLMLELSNKKPTPSPTAIKLADSKKFTHADPKSETQWATNHPALILPPKRTAFAYGFSI